MITECAISDSVSAGEVRAQHGFLKIFQMLRCRALIPSLPFDQGFWESDGKCLGEQDGEQRGERQVATAL